MAQAGNDGLFILNKHHKENFYLVPNYTSFVSSQNNPNFETEIRNAKQFGKVLENTTAALKSDDQQQRYLAAALLISNSAWQPAYQRQRAPHIALGECDRRRDAARAE